MIKKIHSCYFSATGTTKKTVGTFSKLIAYKLNLPIVNYDFTTKKNRQNICIFSKNVSIFVVSSKTQGYGNNNRHSTRQFDAPRKPHRRRSVKEISGTRKQVLIFKNRKT